MNSVLFLGILLVLGLASTRLMKVLKLPNVTGFLIIGLISGVVCVLIDKGNLDGALSESLIELNDITSGIALGFIALSIGEELKLNELKARGKNITVITIFQAIFTAIVVDIVLIIVCTLLHLNLSIAVCLGAIATATAPAATKMVIDQYKAKGELVNTLLPVVAGDDAVGLIVFSISLSIGKLLVTGNKVTFISIAVVPLIEIVGSVVIGLLLGFIMYKVIKLFKSRNNHEVVIITFTLLGVGVCELLSTLSIDGNQLEFSNLLCCMMIGATSVNIAKESERRFVDRDAELIDRWTPFLFMLFFVLSGTHLVTSAYQIFKTSPEGTIGATLIVFASYLVFRTIGKYTGARISSSMVKESNTIRKYLGITLLPQAGVAIGMANSISNISEFKTDNIGNVIVTVVLCATLVYELIGPLLTKWSLKKAGEIIVE